MKHIRIFDTTLCQEGNTFTFKERLEIARQLDRLNVDVIELPEISNVRTDTLFVKTISSFVKESVISIAAGIGAQSIKNAAVALSGTAHPRIRIELPLSPVGMEYTCHKKAPAMLEYIEKSVVEAKKICAEVEFSVIDATRAEIDFLKSAIESAVRSGADCVSISDSAAEMMPDDFAEFTKRVFAEVGISKAVGCANKNGLACAQAILAVRNGADAVKTAVGEDSVSLETFATMIKNCGNSYGFSSSLRYTELNRIINQISWITDHNTDNKGGLKVVNSGDSQVNLDYNDEIDTVMAACSKLGYDLSEDDRVHVYEEFRRVAAKKKVTSKELEAIVASTALQVPPTYKLVNYVINNGNIISASAQITLNKDGKAMQGVCIGDGPIDAAFLAIDHIIGHHYELDDFQIQSVTEGKEAMGSALVKLRSGGKLYSGTGISTDIIGASIRAYLNAVNKIVYEDA